MTTDERNQECEKQSEDFKQCLKEAKEVIDEALKAYDEELKKIKPCLYYQHCWGFVGCAKDMTGKLIPGYKTKEDLCFDCNHWDELIRVEHLNPDIICLRVNGRHYQTSISDINQPHHKKYSGFGGRKFVVKQIFNQGLPQVFFTCNMWTQGVIPIHYREKLPDNAEFVNEVYEVVHEDGTRSFGIGKV